MKGNRVFTKDLPGKDKDGKQQQITLDEKTLMEAWKPALSRDELLIPGYNAIMVGSKAVYSEGKRKLKIMGLSPYYEDVLIELIMPVVEQARTFLKEVGGEDGEFNWDVQLGPLIENISNKLLDVMQHYPKMLCQASAKIAEASITLGRKYLCEQVTDQDRADVEALTPDYFYQNVSANYMLENIVMPQYAKLAIADMLQLFFSTLAKYLQFGMANLMEKKTS